MLLLAYIQTHNRLSQNPPPSFDKTTYRSAGPLATSGECRLAEDADRIVAALPAADPHIAAVIEAHRRMWPGKLPS
jgi:hypothetical protein